MVLGDPVGLHATLHPPNGKQNQYRLHIRDNRKTPPKDELLTFPPKAALPLLEQLLYAVQDGMKCFHQFALLKPYIDCGYTLAVLDPEDPLPKAKFAKQVASGVVSFLPQDLGQHAWAMRAIKPYQQGMSVSDKALWFAVNPSRTSMLHVTIDAGQLVVVVPPGDKAFNQFGSEVIDSLRRRLRSNAVTQKLEAKVLPSFAKLANMLDELAARD